MVAGIRRMACHERRSLCDGILVRAIQNVHKTFRNHLIDNSETSSRSKKKKKRRKVSCQIYRGKENNVEENNRTVC